MTSPSTVTITGQNAFFLEDSSAYDPFPPAMCLPCLFTPILTIPQAYLDCILEKE